ncbi:metallophosphoesterase [Pedobacter psychroterrae]|uniref:Metallophosphoesterase n=1 Tax=Pedobacter psychroterrae TaxID=2530453 RepID=A0A4R0NFJ8_9SPHI|nr:metallophosphoesterase [Pedobacter psychroterrae]TCC97992.1 metallophosphoesterase [Pedobacter psychroterrae]
MNWTRRKFILSGMLTAFVLIVLDAFWFEKAFIEFKEYSLTPKSGREGRLKIMQISDLHLNSVNRQLKRLARKVNKVKPDLLFITGDSVDNAANLHILEEFMQLLSPAIKKAAIVGNWEHWSGIDLTELKSLYKRHNCDLLVNEAVQYQVSGITVLVSGIDDFISGSADITKTLLQYKPSDYHIVLNHCPEYSADIIAGLDSYPAPDLILSGHTHGGQINVLGFVPFKPQGSGRYLKGWYDLGRTKMYVSKGVGTSIVPIRFGARAEVAIFNI